MEWQSSADSLPSGFVTEADIRSVLGKPPATGAWREGDPLGNRKFVTLDTLRLETSGSLNSVRIAYETWGTLNDDGSNAVLILHALTGDSHVVGAASEGHPTQGWWEGMVGPGLYIDTDKFFVVAPNLLGGCQGSTGPSTTAPGGLEWGPRFPYLTIRDQVSAQIAFSDALGIDRWHAVIGGSMGGMHALEWAIGAQHRLDRLAVLASPAFSTADQVAVNSVQIEAIRMDPGFNDGDYYDAIDGDGPHRGLALARRMALLNYRSAEELNERFQRSWQSKISPLGRSGRFAVESYLDFHGNKFTRRFDANSYITLVNAMSSHDVGRGRGGVAEALSLIEVPALILGITTDRLFPVEDQALIAANLAKPKEPVVIDSVYGHDAFLIELDKVGPHLHDLLNT